MQDDILDAAIVNMNFNEIEQLNFYQILSDEIIFCVSMENPLATEKELSIDMLKNEPLIMYNTDSVQNQTLMALFENQNIKPQIILHASQLYTIQEFIQHNLGGAFLYASLTKNMHDIVSIPIRPTITQEIGLVWKKGKYINSNTQKLISFTKSFSL